MAWTRKTIRTNTAVLLKAAVLPGTANPVFEAVFEGTPDQVINEDMPAAIIRCGRTRERRLAGPVGFGTKSLSCEVTIDIFVWVDANDDLLGERYLDDCLDGVDVALRSTPNTLSGAVALAYDEVDTLFHDPVNAMQSDGIGGLILLHATRTFTAHGFDGG